MPDHDTAHTKQSLRSYK